jgi:hypothetical protein
VVELEMEMARIPSVPFEVKLQEFSRNENILGKARNN